VEHIFSRRSHPACAIGPWLRLFKLVGKFQQPLFLALGGREMDADRQPLADQPSGTLIAGAPATFCSGV
jgi:hypothetical protein